MSPALSVGTRLGHYELTGLIGAGGMGEVYRGTDTNLKRAVAIKVLPEAFALDVDRLARFQREAEVLASLNHQNIAAVYGLERADGTTALVMELVEGPTLADLIERRAGPGGPAGLPLDEALPIATQIADALEAAHERGIIHRDLKPANIKLRPDGTVKVLDFGLAKSVEPTVTPAPNHSLSPTITTPALMTGAGVILGTAAYMSPEQARGKTLDKRADIWAFGCVLFELLTGRRAFGGEEVADTLAAVLTHEPDLSSLPSGTPVAIDQLLRRCLVKDPRKRLRDIGEARLALDNVATGASSSDRSQVDRAPEVSIQHSFRQAIPWIAASVLVTALIAGAAWTLARPSDVAITEFRTTILPPEGTLPFEYFGSQLFALSPDGRHIAMICADPDGQRRLWVRPTNSLSARVLRGTEGAVAPFWSPDSQSIGFAAEDALKRVEIAGGLPIMISSLGGAGAQSFSSGSWGPDGTIVYAGLATRVVLRVPATGGQPVDVSRLDQSRGETSHSQPSLLPDGRHFLFYAGRQGEPLGLYVGAIDDAAYRVRVLERGSRARYAAGHLFFTRDRELVAQPFNLDTFTLRGEAVVVAEDVDIGGATGASGAFSVSTAGAIVYQGRGVASHVQLEWIDRSGDHVGTLGEAGGYFGPEISPDGSRTVVTALSGDPGNRGDLVIFDNATGARIQFTNGPSSEVSPVWAPDGRRLAFANPQPANRQSELIVKSPGSNEETALLTGELQLGLPTSWSRDDRFLLFTRAPSNVPNRIDVQQRRSSDIRVVPLTGERTPREYRATGSDEEGGVFSADGRFVAYFSNESGRNEIYVAPFPDGTQPQRVTSTGGLWPQWRADGKELFYLAADGTLMAVDVTQQSSRLHIGAPRSLFRTTTQATRKPYSPSPDGQRFLVATTVGEATSAPLTLLVRRW